MMEVAAYVLRSQYGRLHRNMTKFPINVHTNFIWLCWLLRLQSNLIVAEKSKAPHSAYIVQYCGVSRTILTTKFNLKLFIVRCMIPTIHFRNSNWWWLVQINDVKMFNANYRNAFSNWCKMPERERGETWQATAEIIIRLNSQSN